MSSWRDLIPVPLAAPETDDLRKARFRVIWGCAFVASILLFFGPLQALLGAMALALLVAGATFVGVQGWLWVSAKNAADDAWLFRESDDAS